MSDQPKVVLVTGASRGIGRAIARQFASEGAYVIGTSTSTSGAQSITDRLAGEGCAGAGKLLDVSQANSIDNLFEDLRTTAMLPTVLVNNAGITRDGLLARMSDSQWDEVLNTNLTAIFRTCKACARHMMKARAGRIINISSVVGSLGNAGQVNYAAAKAGLDGFTRSLARELGPRGITVNAVAPGFIETDMTDSLTEEQRNDLLAQIPLKRLGQITDVAALVSFLASPGAGYITGQTLHVNGGMYMG